MRASNRTSNLPFAVSADCLKAAFLIDAAFCRTQLSGKTRRFYLGPLFGRMTLLAPENLPALAMLRMPNRKVGALGRPRRTGERIFV
jgi:hypothetical protein